MATKSQDMWYRLLLINYDDSFGVIKAAIRYKTNGQYIYRWKRRFDGSMFSLCDLSRMPHHLLGKAHAAWLLPLYPWLIPFP